MGSRMAPCVGCVQQKILGKDVTISIMERMLSAACRHRCRRICQIAESTAEGTTGQGQSKADINTKVCCCDRQCDLSCRHAGPALVKP